MPTVLDVARLAGVSSATVSRVLSGRDAVTDGKREKVMAAVKALDFQPDQMAQGLRRGRSNVVALVISDIQQGVNAALAKSIQTALAELGLDMTLYDLNHDLTRLEGLLERTARMRLHGLVFAVTDVIPRARVAPMLKALIDQGVAVVATGQPLHRYGIPSVIHEEAHAVCRSVSYLIEHKRTPVMFIGRITGSVLGRERYKGYQKALAQHGIEEDAALVWDRAFRFQAGHDAVGQALAQGVKFRAIQASSDEIALGATSALLEAGLRIPEDVAVIGAGNVDWAAHMRPAMTTLGSQPDLIAAGVRQVFRDYQTGGVAPRLNTVERPLLLRASA